jgi:hypothetical protein
MTIPPPDLSTTAVSAQKQIVTRAGSIYITNPDQGIPVATFYVEQKLWLDGIPIMPLPMDNPDNPGITQIVRALTPDVVTQTIEFTDPVTGQDMTVSVAGVAAILTQIFATWYGVDLAALQAAQNPPPPSS